jgi:hypothetical protein
MNRTRRPFQRAVAVLAIAMPAMAAALDGDEIMRLSGDGVDADEIIGRLETSGTAHLLSARDVLTLLHSGVDGRVIEAMLGSAQRPAVYPEPPAPQEAAIQATFDDLLLLAYAGVPDGIIVAFIESRHAAFVIDVAEVEELRAAGLGDDIIETLLERNPERVTIAARNLLQPAALSFPAAYPPAGSTAPPGMAQPYSAWLPAPMQQTTYYYATYREPAPLALYDPFFPQWYVVPFRYSFLTYSTYLPLHVAGTPFFYWHCRPSIRPVWYRSHRYPPTLVIAHRGKQHDWKRERRSHHHWNNDGRSRDDGHGWRSRSDRNSAPALVRSAGRETPSQTSRDRSVPARDATAIAARLSRTSTPVSRSVPAAAVRTSTDPRRLSANGSTAVWRGNADTATRGNSSLTVAAVPPVRSRTATNAVRPSVREARPIQTAPVRSARSAGAAATEVVARGNPTAQSPAAQGIRATSQPPQSTRQPARPAAVHTGNTGTGRQRAASPDVTNSRESSSDSRTETLTARGAAYASDTRASTPRLQMRR